MNRDAHSRRNLRYEDLAAYVDGELDPITLMHVERWLARDLAAGREVEAHRYLAELLRATRPDDPSELEWAMAAMRTERRARIPHAKRWRLLPRLNLQTAAVAALAATVLLAVTFGPLPPDRAPAPTPVDDFSVLSPGDVDMVSLDPADARALLIDDVPLREPFIPVLPADVHVTSMRPNAEGLVPRLRVPREDSSFPMIVAPVHRAAVKKIASRP